MLHFLEEPQWLPLHAALQYFADFSITPGDDEGCIGRSHQTAPWLMLDLGITMKFVNVELMFKINMCSSIHYFMLVVKFYGFHTSVVIIPKNNRENKKLFIFALQFRNCESATVISWLYLIANRLVIFKSSFYHTWTKLPASV